MHLDGNASAVTNGVRVTFKDRKRSLSGKKDHNALWHYRSSNNAKLRVVAVLKQLVVAGEKQPQREMSFNHLPANVENMVNSE